MRLYYILAILLVYVRELVFPV